MRVRSLEGGQFQVIPPGGLDDQEEYFLETVVRPGATVKLAGGQFQQYIEVLAIEQDVVLIKNAGWARFIGEFSRERRIPYGCEASESRGVRHHWVKSRDHLPEQHRRTG